MTKKSNRCIVTYDIDIKTNLITFYMIKKFQKTFVRFLTPFLIKVEIKCRRYYTECSTRYVQLIRETVYIFIYNK